MKDFTELLKENGIRIPEKKEWMSDRLFARITKVFQNKWYKPREAYNNYVKAVEKNSRLHKLCEEQLKENGYEAKMPIIKIRRFNNPIKALQAINEATQLLTISETNHRFLEVQNQCRKAWFEKILENRPEGCKLVIVKNIKYKPSADLVEYFEESVARCEQACIWFVTTMPAWIAFKPDCEQDTDYWAIDPKSAIVQYI